MDGHPGNGRLSNISGCTGLLSIWFGYSCFHYSISYERNAMGNKLTPVAVWGRAGVMVQGGEARYVTGLQGRGGPDSTDAHLLPPDHLFRKRTLATHPRKVPLKISSNTPIVRPHSDTAGQTHPPTHTTGP